MDRFFIKKLVTSIIFIGFVFIFSFQNILTAYNPLKVALKDNKINLLKLEETIKLIESTANENIYAEYSFVDGYGFIQRLMDKNEANNFEVIKDKQGFLHYTSFGNQTNSMYDFAARIESLKNSIKSKDTKFIYLMQPDKYIKGYSELPTGIPYNYANENADKFLELLNKNNINTIDLRENLTKSEISVDKLFFKTNNYWKIETAFWEFGQLVNNLNNKYSVNLDENKFYTDKENYNFITYANSYVGSMGRQAGIFYGGVDDFTLVYPKFKTSYTYYSKNEEQEMTLDGRFEEALLAVSPFKVKKEKYQLEEDKYYAYLFGNREFVHIKNKDNINGAKILLVKDSYTLPLAAFLSTVCSDIYLVDPRYYKEDITSLVNSIDNLDIVFVSFSPQDLTEEFFQFYK